MSELFKLSRVFESVSPDIVNTFNNTTYLSEGINIMRDTEERVFEQTSKLYSSVLEANSTAAENEKFAEFFKEYKDTIECYIRKIQLLASEFSINIGTFADANRDIISSNSSANIVSTIAYKGAKYKNLLDPEVPDIDPQKAFKKEFAFIGRLLQDLGPIGSEEQKAKIIATVCNTLSKEINDGWLEKIIEKVTDCDDCKDGYARAIYKKFVPESSVDMDIDIGLVKQCKLDIANYQKYVDSINTSVVAFTTGLAKVAEEIGSMFFRNKDHKLPIKTDEDGVEDKTYRLNDYSFNQMNMFITTKISQITELCNLYITGISIKMDCIMKYLQQCKDIIDTAEHGVDNTPNTDGVDPGDEDKDNDGTPEPEMEDPDDYDPETEEFEVDNDDGNNDPDDDESENVQDNSESEIETESYLFEAIMFESERSINRYMQQQYYFETVLTEADGDNGHAGVQNKMKNVGAFIDSIIQQIQRLVKTMTDSLKVNYKDTITSVDKLSGKIKNVTPPEGWTIVRINHDPLTEVSSVPEFNVNDLEIMNDKSKYLSEKYNRIINSSKIKEGSSSAKDMILSTITQNGNEDKYTKADIETGIKFITKDYGTIAANIQKMSTSLPGQKSKVQNLANQAAANESALDLQSTLSMYFEDASDVPKDQQKATNKSEAGKTYFKLNSEVITAMMNINAMLMKKHLNFITKLADIAGEKIAPPKLGGDKE